MRLRPWMILVALLAFVAVLLLRFPLRWALGVLPAQVQCAEPAGSVWQGRCGALTYTGPAGAVPLGSVSWDLRKSALLRAHFAGVARFEGPQLRGSAGFDAAPGGDLALAAVDATAPLDRRLLSMVPANWTGRLVLRLPALTIRDNRLLLAQGSIEAHDIVAQGPRPDEFGSYALTFDGAPQGGVHRGMLRDLAGPIELTGTLDVKDDFSWMLDALAKPRATAPPQLQRLLEYLGPPDAQGRRRFGAEGTF
jgi:hypothetical protein